MAVSNLGDAPVERSQNPVMITDKLPAGLTATAVSAGQERHESSAQAEMPPSDPQRAPSQAALNPYERLAVTIKVKVEEPPGTATSLPNEVDRRRRRCGAGSTSTQHCHGERRTDGVRHASATN